MPVTPLPTILLVDDSPLQCATRCAILQTAGYAVLTAPSGAEALSLLRSPESARIDLIITDHSMPGMSGLDLVRELRRFDPYMHIIVLSGLPGLETEYAPYGINFRSKPFPPNELIALAAYLLKQPDQNALAC